MHIIVGVDDSLPAQSALRWALQVAARAGASLEVVRSWSYASVSLQQLLPAEEMDRLAEEGAASALSDQATEGISLRTTVLRGPAHHALAQYLGQRHPDLVVVGRRGGDERARRRALGSVSRRLVDTASCPIAVISNDPGEADPAPTVMVAIDGSSHSERALRWAVGFARTVGGSLLIVNVITRVTSPGAAEELSDQAKSMLERAATEASSKGVEAETVTGFGDPREELERIAEAHGADLIVVGPRGVGGISKLVLGTVASHLTEYAEHPVVVIPAA